MITHQTVSLLPVALPRDATMQQATQNCATSYATAMQQATQKPASLLDISRNKLRNKLATSSQNSRQQAPQKTSEDVAQKITYWRWLVHCPDRDFEISTVPESSLDQVLLDFPTATSAEPILDTPKRKATCSETTELTALVNLIYASDTVKDLAEALAAALGDPDDALTCYLAMQNTLHSPKAALSLPGNVFAPPSPNKRSTAHPAQHVIERKQNEL